MLPPALLRKLFFVKVGNNLNLGCYVGIRYLLGSFAAVTFESSTPCPNFRWHTNVRSQKYMCAFLCIHKNSVWPLASTQISVRRHRNLCGTHYRTQMTLTTIYVKTKEMCKNFPGKVDHRFWALRRLLLDRNGLKWFCMFDYVLLLPTYPLSLRRN
jgi:hypothetical protein